MLAMVSVRQRLLVSEHLPSTMLSTLLLPQSERGIVEQYHETVNLQLYVLHHVVLLGVA
jgi:hypothetical protein